MAQPTLDTHTREHADTPPKTPRWVIVFAIIALVLVTATLLELTIRGPHRPGMPGMQHGGQAPATSVVAPGGGGLQ